MQPPKLFTPVAKKPIGYCEPTTKTCPKPNSLSKLHQTHQPEYHHPSGNKSSEEMPLISIKSSRHSTMLSLMKRGRVAWETQNSLWESLTRKNMSRPRLNGPLPGGTPLEPFPSCFPIGEPNCLNMETISKKNSQQNCLPHITRSSSMISPSEMKSALGRIPSLRIPTNLLASTPPSLCQTELKHTDHHFSTRNQPAIPQAVDPKFVTDITSGPVDQQMLTPNIDTFAKVVEKPVTPRSTVWQGANEVYGLQPKYLQHNLWESSSSLSPTTAEWSEYAAPLPRPPISETTNHTIHKTITDNPELFQIKLLVNHPNQPFIQSVCAGLHEGFWPWVGTLHEDLPITHDESRTPPSDLDKATFICDQCHKEQVKNQFSKPFGPALLPGMYSMPVHAVEKPNSSDLRLVNNHSAGPFSLNHMIDHSKVTGFPLDNLRHLREILLNIRKSLGNIPLTMCKSDISEAYRLLPVSSYWQIKQIVTVDGARYVDRNLAFRSSASPAIFISFNSLVAWITKYEKLFDYLANYIDDSSGCDLEGDTMFYEPYGQLLDLWDELGIPHKHHKQLSGTPLTIIGISVNPNEMTLPESSKTCLLDELLFWSSKPPKPSSGSFKLKHWERMTRWFNWALNVYPYLCPALNNVYAKIKGKQNREQQIHINNAIRSDFEWAINHLKSSNSVQILKSLSWTPSTAHFTIYCDVCPDRLGFWYPDSKEGYYAPTPVNVPSNVIFYFESLSPPGSKIVIYTDNSNTVDIFRSYHSLPPYNHLLKDAVDIILCHQYSLRILHVPGEANIIADALPRMKFSVALALEPSLKVFSFHPPRYDNLRARLGLGNV
ncbi:hypothetical protein BYT27DRAFT_7225344 [Phlegmacium glaucopus]|nr:hypothetical protein BYT27DRAFT_7225344 [Phlegmacium glaucopus]